MSEILGALADRLALLQKYEARYGPLDGPGAPPPTTITISAPTPLNTLQVTIPQPASGSGSASAGSGVNTPESSPY
jgi:adenylate cyclase